MLQRFVQAESHCRPQLRMVINDLLRCLSFSMLGLLYYVYNYWYDYLLYICIIPMVITFFLTLFLLVEGPYFLYRNNRIEECLASLKFIATVNGTLDKFEEATRDFKYDDSKQTAEEEMSVCEGLKNLLTSKKYLKITVILCFI